MKKSSIIIGALAFAIGIGVAQYVTMKPSAPQDTGGTVTPITEGKFGGDFTLMKENQAVKLSDFRGKLVVMYFGYASCPDVCPTTLSIIASALKELTPEELAQVQPIFISVDPERDQGEKLTGYATHFHPSFIGITGTPEEVQKVAGIYGAFFAKVDSDSAMGYLVDHTSQTYMISKDGKYANILPHDMTREDVLKGIRTGL